LGKVLDQTSSKSTSTATTSTSSSCPVVANAEPSTLTSLALVVLGGGVASFLRTTMLNRAQDNIASRVRSETFSKLLTHKDLEWFQTNGGTNNDNDVVDDNDTNNTLVNQTKNSNSNSSSNNHNDNDDVPISTSPAALNHILTNEVQKLSESLTTTLANLLRSTCSCIFATTHMIQLNPSLLGLSLSIVPVIGSSAVILNKFVKKVSIRQRHNQDLASSFAEERLSHIATVKSSSREQHEANTYHNLQLETARLGRITSLAKGAFMGFMFAASSGALFAVFRAGGKAVHMGRMSHGDLTSFSVYTFMLGLGTSGIIGALGDLVQGSISAQRIFGIVGTGLEDNDKTNTHNANTTNTTTSTANEHNNDADKTTIPLNPYTIDDISIQNLNFAYASNPNKPVLQNISFQIQRGQVIALVGKNGSGKSTLASILAGLYKPTSGTITLQNNTNYHTLHPNTRSKIVQLVPQRPAFFDISLVDNVTYTHPNATPEEISTALHNANCSDFVSKLEGTLQYKVGRNGHKLSGGQRQRLALARALLSDPSLLILDEPSNSLDSDGQQAVEHTVNACKGILPKDAPENATTTTHKRGLILITHKLDSLSLADTIVVLKNGRIAEIGSFKDLTRDKDSELCKLMPDLQ